MGVINSPLVEGGVFSEEVNKKEVTVNGVNSNKISKFLDKNRQIKLVKLLFPCYYEHRNLKQQTAAKIKERCERK